MFYPRKLDPEANFPRLGVVAYLKTRGPVRAYTLAALASLRALEEYESCNPVLDDFPHWDFSRAALPRTHPLRVSGAEIAVEWDPGKLTALINASREDLVVLGNQLIAAEREIYDIDRVIEDALRRQRVGLRPGDRLPEAAFPALHNGTVEIPSAKKYEVDKEWDVYKLREVVSAIQADVGRLADTLADFETELRDKQQLVGRS